MHSRTIRHSMGFYFAGARGYFVLLLGRGAVLLRVVLLVLGATGILPGGIGDFAFFRCFLGILVWAECGSIF